MPDTITPVYEFVAPEVGASDDTWGTKLNADIAKLEALLISGFDGGTPVFIGTVKGASIPGTIAGDKTFTGLVTLSHAAPTLSFSETDQVDPAGRYRFQASASNFSFQKALTANWATSANVWSYDLATDLLSISSKVNSAGNVSIKNTLPVLWLQDTNASFRKDWALWNSSNTLRLGRADVNGVPDKNYISMYDDIVLFEATDFKIQNTYPTISFADTSPSGDQYFNISAGNGWFRFSTATSAGVPVEDMMQLSRGNGLRVLGNAIGTGDIIAEGSIAAVASVTGNLIHRINGGYFHLGCFNSTTYGNGTGRLWYQHNAGTIHMLDSSGYATVQALAFAGDGSDLTGITADQVTSLDGVVGTYKWLLGTASGDTSGASVAGSSLRTPNFQVKTATNAIEMSYTSGPPGTWRCMQSTSCAADEQCAGMWLRIA